MAFPLSSTEISFSFLGSVSHNNNLISIAPKGSTLTGLAGSKGASYGVEKKAFISSTLVPGRPLEGSIAGKKQLNVPSLNSGFVRTLLIDNYDSYTYNVYQELSVVNGMPPVVIRNDEWSWEDAYHYIYEERAFDNIVISPGPGSPTCTADIGICLRLLLECGDIPILGVCLGHQALGFAHGAQVVHAPEPIHGRLSEVEHDNSGLFHGIPSGLNSGFKVVRYHSLVIDPSSLPRELIPIAWSSANDTSPLLGTQILDSYTNGYEREVAPQIVREFLSEKSENGSQWQSNKILMGIMHSSRPHYGLQFHPESIGTCYGRQLFENFADITRNYWSQLRLSLNGVSAAHYASCMQMQVPNGAQLFRDTPRSNNHLVNGLDASCNKSAYLQDSRNGKFLKLKWRKVECSVSQVGGAENIFSNLFGKQDAENTFWLDSSSTDNRARFSFMGGKGGLLWRQLTYRLSDNSVNGLGNLSIEDSEGLVTSVCLKDGFFDFLDKELGLFRYDATDYEGLPFDFYGGYIGYIGYDLKVECGASSNLHKSSAPDACFFFTDNLVVIDHHCDDIYVMSIHDKSESETSSWLDETEQKLICMKSCPPRKSLSRTSVNNSEGEGGFSAEKSRGQYMEDVVKCQEFIKDGESYELCLTAQMTKRVGEINPLELYCNLREKNPAPYAAWLNFSKQNLCICSSSPERFLRLDRNGVLEAKPIKGTISRGLSPEEDEARRLRLQHSEKDQAENLMIVDLLRNDLGRVCVPGSVHVPRLMEIESYATVHTMVSTIQGQKKSNASAVDCVRAAFPGGSMTGAPKLRSMEILDSLESSSRGIYSGCIGYFSYNQTFDLNIVIRTVVLHEGKASIGAGGAITALSNPNDEYEEMVLKTRAPTEAVTEHVNMKRSTSYAKQGV